MRKWGDPKRFLFEDLILYGTFVVMALLWDYGVNLLRAAGVDIFTHETGMHPVEFGRGQAFWLIFSLVQFTRKYSDFRYHK